jgi:hypothetical protein
VFSFLLGIVGFAETMPEAARCWCFDIFLHEQKFSLGLLRHLGKEENETRNFPCVFYATLSDVRWNIKRARRNFQAQPKEKGNHTSTQLSPGYPALFSVRPALSS